MHSFVSDYACAPHPAVVKAVENACLWDHLGSYGEDVITRGAAECFREVFGKEVAVFFVSSGTAANRLALQTLLKEPYSAVLCTEEAHINNAEAGAIESLGHKLLTLPNCPIGKVNFAAVDQGLQERSDIHLAYPQVLSLSNATEVGTVYSVLELQEIASYAHEHMLSLHIDGARFSNAFAYLGPQCLVADRTDAMTFGGTKNGGMMGEAVLFWDHHLAAKAERLQKQQGQLCARMHCLSAQFVALLTDELWLKNARHSNAMATRLAERCENELNLKPAYPVQSNAVFVALPQQLIELLQQETKFYVWDKATGLVRWMCSWDTTEKNVDELIDLVKKHSL